MKRLTIMTLVSCLVVAFIVIGFSISFAGPQEIKQIPGPITIKLKPDLVVDAIYGHCPDCRCGRTNFGNHYLVEYQEDIIVYIVNQGKVASAPCKLKIELYDVLWHAKTGKKAVIIKDVPRLNPGQRYGIDERGEYLYRKSDGIKATVDSTNVVDESNERNNSMTVHECEPELI